DGTVYVAFLNHQAQGDTLRDQVLIVSSTDAGDHWSPPRQVVGLIHDGAGDYPVNWRSDSTLTGCQFRIFAAGNLVMSTAAANTGQLYYVYAEALDPGATARTNIMATTSVDGGASWSTPALVKSSRYDQIFPWADVGLDGKVRVGFVDRARSAPRGQMCVYGYTLATASDLTATSFATKRLDTGASVDRGARSCRRGNVRFPTPRGLCGGSAGPGWRAAAEPAKEALPRPPPRSSAVAPHRWPRHSRGPGIRPTRARIRCPNARSEF